MHSPSAPEVPSGVAIYVNTQVVLFDSQEDTAGVTTNQLWAAASSPAAVREGSLYLVWSLLAVKVLG